MKFRILLALMMALLLCGSGSAAAEEKFGVMVYPGAEFDASISEFLVKTMSLEAVCYRTSGEVAEVVEFYQQQPGLKLIGSATKEGAFFRRCQEEFDEILKMNISAGCDLDITVQSPWMDMQTGRTNKDTLISVVRREQ